MKQRYVVNIQNLDNLDDVQIEVSPFTIFTGDNNSGKTVVMNIMYGLSRLSRNIIQSGDKFSKEYRACKNFIKDLRNLGEGCIDSEVGSIFCDFFNRSLLCNKEYFFNKIFNVSIENNYKRFENTKVFLSNYRIFPKIWLSIDDYCDEIVIEGNFVKIPKDFLRNEDGFLSFICSKVIHDGFSDIGECKPVFMPSGRSTFLCYSEIFKNLKYKNLSIDDFINNIENLRFSDNGVYASIYNFIEEDIIKGSFTKDSYRSHVNNIEIPISMASDFIREIASLVLFLKSDDRFTAFFIEEIETHLNLSLQRNVVSVLSRIINSGTSIFMSTNSNIILDQICNFILLSNLNREKISGFGYVINDILNADDINIYEFGYVGSSVTVNRVSIGYDGFEAKFNDRVIDNISKENLQLKIEIFDRD